MKWNQSNATLFIPDGEPEEQALSRTTHLGIGAHQDDLEFMALHGILQCYNRNDRWFGGITCTNGSGSARTGAFATFTDDQMMAVRREEQNAAARLGQYGFMLQLDYPSSQIKSASDTRLAEELTTVLTRARPDVVYTHNPADKHATHIGVVNAVLHAIRAMPADQRPGQVLGCEVWRALDWMQDEDKVVLDVSGRDELARALNAQFASQIAGGKRYDLAVEGRRCANATFYDSHTTDALQKAWYAMDLTPLIEGREQDVVAYTLSHIHRFRDDVAAVWRQITEC